MKNDRSEALAQSTAHLIDCLAEEKERLCVAIGCQLIEDKDHETSKCGARGRLPGFPGAFFVNCSRAGKPCGRTGRGVNGLSHYFWIPVQYKEDGIELDYSLALFQEDIDASTGNLHVDFTKLQMSRLRCGGPEIGGGCNPRPTRIDGGFRIDYMADDSFPCAVRSGGRFRSVIHDDAPWGYEDISEPVPIMEMTSEEYDPEAVACFFLALIRRDISQRNKGAVEDGR